MLVSISQKLSILFSLHTIMTRASSAFLSAPRRSTRLLNQSNIPAEDDCKAQAIPRSTKRRSAPAATVSQTKKAARDHLPANIRQQSRTKDNTSLPLLLNLGHLVKGRVLKRPSSTIKSPYVADVTLSDSTTALAHAPALDCAGMCVPGRDVYMSTRPAGGKTSHAIELVVSDGLGENDKVLVGAHPRLGELIAFEVLKRGLLMDVLPLTDEFQLGKVDDVIVGSPKKPQTSKNDNEVPGAPSNKQQISLRQQVTLGDSRVDFQMTIQNGKKSHRIIFEVKNVVCADYQKGTEPVKTGANHCVVVAEPSEKEYQRTALFPWAKSRSQTFEDKKVCSARALKHLRNLHDLAQEENVTPVVLFIINRSDCESVRACHEACPVFKDVLEEVTRDGAVRALGVRVKWTENGECYFDGVIPVHT